MKTTRTCTGALRFLGLGRLQVPRGWAHAAHAHPFHQLMLVFGGQLHVSIAGKTHEVGAGGVIVYPAGTVHAESVPATGGADFIYLACEGRLPALPSTFVDADGHARVLGHWLAQEHLNPGPGSAGLVARQFVCFIAECERSAAERVPVFVQKVRAHCAARLGEPLDLAGLARLVAMSPAHFGRRYRHATGGTPMSDLRRLRVQAAHDLLLTTTLPLKAIAEQVGFCDAYHLSREVRRALGRPPSRLR